MNEKKLKKKRSLISSFGCLRSQTSSPDRSSSDEKPYMEMESVTSEDGPLPTSCCYGVLCSKTKTIARYAIGRHYSSNPEHNLSEGNGDRSGDGIGSACLEKKLIVKVARLEPMNL
ncbi:hypothetical protein C5167_037327 [Papaver somniferum]|uniref:Uncharacterized protein n=1 Tax=Papaver somniferum TaxID=3469 RepID=A0A4Y7IA47_PAPSO|nr:hypothetical protein C5167_037327 [Papaver somniferum]